MVRWTTLPTASVRIPAPAATCYQAPRKLQALKLENCKTIGELLFNLVDKYLLYSVSNKHMVG